MARHTYDPADFSPDGRPPAKQRLFDPAVSGPWRGHLPGEVLGTSNTVLAYGNDTPGEGPKLHVHPYDEIFIVVEGSARFFVGEDIIDAEAGEIVLGPKGVPHRFENIGSGRLQTIDIHLGPQWCQADL
jgi:mannose-6-phosphate isomerase-like protein (cupin superfamily)